MADIYDQEGTLGAIASLDVSQFVGNADKLLDKIDELTASFQTIGSIMKSVGVSSAQDFVSAAERICTSSDSATEKAAQLSEVMSRMGEGMSSLRYVSNEYDALQQKVEEAAAVFNDGGDLIGSKKLQAEADVFKEALKEVNDTLVDYEEKIGSIATSTESIFGEANITAASDSAMAQVDSIVAQVEQYNKLTEVMENFSSTTPTYLDGVKVSYDELKQRAEDTYNSIQTSATEAALRLEAGAEQELLEIQRLEQELENLKEARTAVDAEGSSAMSSGFVQKIQEINDKIEEHKQKLDEINNKYEELKNATEVTSSSSQGLWQQFVEGVKNSDSLKNSIDGLKTVSGELKNVMNSLPVPIAKVTGAMGKLTLESLKFCFTPLGAILMSVVALLKGFHEWTTKSAEGQREMELISAYVGGVLQGVSKILMALGRALYETFANAGPWMKLFADGMKMFVGGALKGVIDLILTVYDTIALFVKGVKSLYDFSFGRADAETLKSDIEGLKGGFDNLKKHAKNAMTDIGEFAVGTIAAVSSIIPATVETLNGLNNTGVLDQIRDMENVFDIGERNLELKRKEQQVTKDGMALQMEELEITGKIAQARAEIYTLKGQEKLDKINETLGLVGDKYKKLRAQAEAELKVQEEKNRLLAGGEKLNQKTDKFGRKNDDISQFTTLEGIKKEAELRQKLANLDKQEAMESRFLLRQRATTKKSIANEKAKGDKASNKAAKDELKTKEKIAQLQAQMNEEQRKWLEKYNREQEDLVTRIVKLQNQAKKNGVAKDNEALSLQQGDEITDLIRERDDALQQVYDHAKSRFDKLEQEAKAKDQKHEVQQFDRDKDLTEEDNAEIDRITSQYQLIEEELNKLHIRQWEERREADMEYWNEYLQTYGSVEEQRAAIAASFDKKIEEQRKADGSLTKQGELLSKQKEEKLFDFDVNAVQKKFSIDNLFGMSAVDGLSTKLTDQVELALTRLMERAENLQPEKVEQIRNMLLDIQNLKASKGLISYKDAMREMLDARYEMLVAQQDMNEADMAGIGDLYAEALGSGNKEAQEEILNKTIETTAGTKTYREVLENLTKSQKKYSDALGVVNKAQDAIKRRIQVSTRAFSEIGKIASMTGEVISDAIGKDLAKEIGKTISSIISTVTGVVNTLTSLTDDAGNAMSLSAFMASKSISNVEKASVILAIISAALQVAMSIANLFMGNKQKAIDDAIKGKERSIHALEKSYERLEEKLNKSYSNEASKTYEDMNRNIERQNALIRQQMELEKQKKQNDAELADALQDYQDKLDANEKKIRENKEAAIDAIIGSDISSAIDGFASKWADAWAAGENRATSAKAYVIGMMQDMLKEAMKADVAKPMENLRKKMVEYLQGDGIITADEKDALVSQAKEMSDALADKYEWAKDIIRDTTEDIQGTSGGFATMSQESADELNGRFAQSQVTLYGILDHVALASEYQQLSHAEIANINTQMSEVVDIQRESVEYLSSIASYTSNLVGMNNTLSLIYDEVKRI